MTEHIQFPFIFSTAKWLSKEAILAANAEIDLHKFNQQWIHWWNNIYSAMSNLIWLMHLRQPSTKIAKEINESFLVVQFYNIF